MDFFLCDLKHGFRTLGRSPGFTTVAVLSLALGIGANTAIFTLTSAVFLNPLPIEDAGRVMQVYTVDNATTTTAANRNRTPISFPNYVDFRGQNNVFSGFVASMGAWVAFTGHGAPERQAAALVSANFFDVLGVKPALGRFFFADEDQRPGANAVAVLSHSLWTRQFGADSGVIGRTITLNSVSYTVIGVAPPNFKGTSTVSTPDWVWIPISMHTQALTGTLDGYFNERRMRMVGAFGRLKPGVTREQALAAMKTIAARLAKEDPKANEGCTVDFSSLPEAALGFLPRGQAVTAGIALSATVALVLLIASVNLANLLLARSAKRAREMGIRTALGAGRGRLVRQLLTENLLLALAGGACGLFLGWLGYRMLWSFRPSYLAANSIAAHMDGRVFAFTFAVTLVTALLFGLAPALRASTPDLSEVLKTGGRGGTEAWGRSVLRAALVVSEVALSLVALAGAGLFARSMQRLESVDPGFETRNLFVFNLDVSPRHYPADRAREFFRSVLDKAQTTPGVRNAALASKAPLGGGMNMTVLVEGQDNNPDRKGTLTITAGVSPGYFDAMRIPLLEGRALSDFDRAGSTPVAVVNQAMARHFWPGQSAVGKRFRFVLENAPREVVGVVADSVAFQLSEKLQPIIYTPLWQQFSPSVYLHVRTLTNPEAILPVVRARVQSLDDNLPLTGAFTIQQLMTWALWTPRLGATLFGIFGVLGMLLASIGIYGVMAYMVTQRSNEIGIRMALGARPGDVLRLVVGESMRLALAGVAIGVLAALAVTRLMSSLLFDVTPHDPLTYAAVSVVLAGVALLAGWLPARRAARIDPLAALRQE